MVAAVAAAAALRLLVTASPALVAVAAGMAVLLGACVSQNTYNRQVQKTSTYQQLDAQLKSELADDQAQLVNDWIAGGALE